MTVRTVPPSLKLLGTAGTLLANQKFLEGFAGLLIHADNFMARGSRKLSWVATPITDSPSCELTMLDLRDQDTEQLRNRRG